MLIPSLRGRCLKRRRDKEPARCFPAPLTPIKQAKVQTSTLDKRADFSKSSTTHYSAHDSGGFFPSLSALRTLFVLGHGMFSTDILFGLFRTYAFIYP